MSPGTATRIVRDFVLETGSRLTPSQAADVAFILEGFEVVQTGLHEHVVVGSTGEPEVRVVNLDLPGFLAELAAPYNSKDR